MFIKEYVSFILKVKKIEFVIIYYSRSGTQTQGVGSEVYLDHQTTEGSLLMKGLFATA